VFGLLSVAQCNAEESTVFSSICGNAADLYRHKGEDLGLW
jgi:hypothetical protein